MLNKKLYAWALIGALSIGVVGCVDEESNRGDSENNGLDAADRTLGGKYSEALTLEDIIEDPTKPDYFVTSSVQMAAKLTVMPGVVIEFAPDTGLEIDGSSGGIIDIQGTEELPVVLTGKNKVKGSWHGVYLNNSQSSENRMDWGIIEYGGGKAFDYGLTSNLGVGGFTSTSTIAITNSSFLHSKAYGLDLKAGSRLDAFSDNYFEGNTDSALRIPPEQLNVVDNTTAFVGDSEKRGIEIFTGKVSKEAVWKKPMDGAPILVTGDIQVDAKLTMEPGVALYFGDNVSMTVDGREGGVLVAKGSSDDNILMTGMDGVFWSGLYILQVQSSQNVMEHVTMEYGGYTNPGYSTKAFDKANLVIGGFTSHSTMSIKDSTFRNSASHGIAIQKDSVVNSDISTANVFEDNAEGDVYFQP